MQASTEPLILQQAFVAGFFNTRENSLCDEGELKNVWFWKMNIKKAIGT